MKKLFLLLFSTFALHSGAQQNPCSVTKQRFAKNLVNQGLRTATLSPQISHEIKYDVKFVHLNLNLERINTNVSGGVTTIANVTAASLDTFQTLLHQNYTIDSVRINGILLASTRKDSMIKVAVPAPLASGSTFTTIVYYHGIAPVGGAAIGSGYSTGTSGAWGAQVSWSLSESLVAYHWWPCKQILTDKIDSSWVYITTDSTNKVGSNGILKNVVVVGNKKRYEWQSRIPIDYYLISVAVAQYKEYRLYAHPMYLPNDSILIQNYIYNNAINNPSWISSQKVQLDKMPKVLEFESKMYGMYPFFKEKYGHCMAPFGGGMEHQTMTSLGFFDYYVDAHELGHQWFGDNVTCKSWADIWINEGWATYTELLVAQYLDSVNFAGKLNGLHNNVMSLPGGSIYFTDTLNTTRIFDGRLSYDKGGAIIHSLRFLTNNDSLWFNTVRGFQNTFKHSTASGADFRNYYTAQTGINATQFFNQWYYGEGYPTFTLKYNSTGNVFHLQSTQSTSTPSSIALFITPMEYKILRTGAPDTIVRVNHASTVENYSFVLTGTVTGLVCDPNNWIINQVIDSTVLGVKEIKKNLADIKIGPNPTKGIFSINSARDKSLKAKISDINGRLLLEKTFEAQTTIDLSNYCNGIYFVRIIDDSGNELRMQKIIKQ